MDQEQFIKNFEEAVDDVIHFTRKLVINNLPDAVRYVVCPNQSFDGNPLEDDEEIFPEEKQTQCMAGGISFDEVVNYLWRDGKVPEWINLQVDSASTAATVLRLECCGRFTSQEKHLYHRAEGHPPFHCSSPDLPIEWESVEKSGKVDLYWRQLGKK